MNSKLEFRSTVYLAILWTLSHNLNWISPFSSFSETHGATDCTSTCSSNSSVVAMSSNDDDVEGISSAARDFLKSGRRSFFSTSWLFLGRFSVGTLPVIRIFLVGSKYYVKIPHSIHKYSYKEPWCYL